LIEGKVLDALGVQMNFTIVIPREALEQFGQSAFRAVATVNER
jgi:hypothetical protein